MSGRSGNCYCRKWLLLLGSNPSDQDGLAKRLEPILLSLNDRAVGLVRSLEHVHRLVEVYLLWYSHLKW